MITHYSQMQHFQPNFNIIQHNFSRMVKVNIIQVDQQVEALLFVDPAQTTVVNAFISPYSSRITQEVRLKFGFVLSIDQIS